MEYGKIFLRLTGFTDMMYFNDRLKGVNTVKKQIIESVLWVFHIDEELGEEVFRDTSRAWNRN